MKYRSLILALGALAALALGCTRTAYSPVSGPPPVPQPQQAHRSNPRQNLETEQARHEEMVRHWNGVYRAQRLAAAQASKARRRAAHAAPPPREGSPTPLGSRVTYDSEGPTHTATLRSAPLTAAVYVTLAGQKFHAAGCRYVRYGQFPTSRKNALAQGYERCSVCGP
jgi:hypothetical protein